MTNVSETSIPHILIVDDDEELRELLNCFLRKHNFRIITAKDGREMAIALRDWSIDLIVMDLMMPGDDGLALCRKIRMTSAVPIIMLSALAEDVDRIIGLEVGADDYMVKPFNPLELAARITTVLRRATMPPLPSSVDANAEKLKFADLELEKSTRTLRRKDQVVSLSPGEYDLLVVFAEHPRQLLNRDQLLHMARCRAAIPFDRSIDVQIGRLRQKIELDTENPILIKTVRSVGYILTAEVSRV